jgi:hypothetical protein
MSQKFANSVLGLGLALLLGGCAQGGSATTATATSAPQLATTTESLHTVVPPGMKLGLHRMGEGFEVAEYIPADQAIGTWSNLFAATMLARKPGVTLPQLVTEQQQGAVNDCTMPPAATAPSYFTDGGLPAVAQGIACGRNKSSGQGEMTVIKTVLGNSAVFQIQRAYRLPPVATSAMLHLPPGADTEMATRLQYSFVCPVQNPQGRCK